ncbi:DUF4124 domain-containing protein [Hydrocarboniphaga sp.]|uniref:DUF4124 domain-containing protein n=1 Tax=Hydrocarboniphaga sp. TaxID=2033016 RepID=UPI003D124A1E
MNHRLRRLRRQLRYPGLLWGLILAAASAPLRAEVFRCEQDGKLTFTDTPCDAQAQPIEVAEPLSIEATGGSDLAKDYDERLARERRERIRADSQWLAGHERDRLDEQRIRAALAEGRVVAGMSQSQVRQVWGEPSDVQLQIDQNASRERWVYRAGRGGPAGTRTVTFTDGKVAGGSASSAAHNSKARKGAGDGKNRAR